MKPTIALGPWDSPKIEFMPEDVEPLIILILQVYSPLDSADMASVWSIVGLDTLHLDELSASLFVKLEDISHRVLAGELTQYSVGIVANSEFAGSLDRFVTDGLVTPGTPLAAQRFLNFLAAHPNYWPPRFAEK
jgi:hypothetical protein